MKEKSPKSDEQKEGTIRSGERVVYRRPEFLANSILKNQADVEIQTISQVRGGSHDALSFRRSRGETVAGEEVVGGGGEGGGGHLLYWPSSNSCGCLYYLRC